MEIRAFRPHPRSYRPGLPLWTAGRFDSRGFTCWFPRWVLKASRMTLHTAVYKTRA